MSNKTKQVKRVQKTKEQIIEEEKRIAEATRLRNILKEKIYPVLLQLKNVEETQYFCSGLMDLIKKIANAMSNEFKLSELIFKGKSLLGNIADDNEDKKHYEAVIKALENETINNASAILDGFGYAIQASMRKENKERKVSDFKDFEHHFDQT